MGCCGSKKPATVLEYRVTPNNGEPQTVKTMDEVRLALATGGGGSYRSVPVTGTSPAK